ncbi:MAG: alanyl-tRNA editing protein [Methanobacteriota archaeon]|nr:MAG: alanyl-tRNA editing protein [Euryarchaeota archaeon]
MNLPIYWTDPTNVGPFSTVVEEKEGTKIKLRDKILYPEGGGQPADKGIIEMNGAKVEILDVTEISGDIWVIVDNPDILKIGSPVTIWVDHERRQILRQMHSGQHLFSAILESEFNAKTTRVQMSEEESEINTDVKLSESQLNKAEDLVNQRILENHPIISQFVKKNQVELGRIRGEMKIGEIEGDVVRLVQIGENASIDLNPCGGTHLHSTSEIGLFLITSVDGKRIKFKCGKPAFQYAVKIAQMTRKLRNELSTKPDKMIEKISSMKEEAKRARKSQEKLALDLLEKHLVSDYPSSVFIELEHIPREIFQKWKPSTIPKQPIFFGLENKFLGILGHDDMLEKKIDQLKQMGFKGNGKKGKYLFKYLGKAPNYDITRVIE